MRSKICFTAPAANCLTEIFKAAQQVYSYPWTYQPPWLSWRQLWIEVSVSLGWHIYHGTKANNSKVRCSDGNQGPNAPDPQDICGDATPDPGKCPNGQPPVGGGKATLQAFSDPSPDDSRYSRITFCTDFFKLQDFNTAISNGKALARTQQRDLSRWDNQARCMFHEITHLDYFMNAGDDDSAKSPYVSDLEIFITEQKHDDWQDAYGPRNARILRNYVDSNPKYSGYYTQRNADNYAFFALAKYVEKQTGQYPEAPKVGVRKPKLEPRDARTHEEPLLSGTSVDEALIGGEEDDVSPSGDYPGCSDKIGKSVPAQVESASISSQYASATPSPTPSASSLPPPECSPSGVAFPQPPVEDFIDNFCNDRTYWDTVLTPSVSFGTGQTSDGRGKALGVSNPYDLPDTSDKLWIAMMFTRDNCTGASQFTFGKDDDAKLAHCKDRFRTVLNGCQTDTITEKFGGMLQDVCIEYRITGQPDGAKPFDGWFGNGGDFTCKDTDYLGNEDSPLKGTCTCWYSNYSTITDVFKMPSSGNCKDTNRADLLTN